MEPQAEQTEQTNSVVPPPPPSPTANKLITSDVPATKPEKHPGRVAAGKRVGTLRYRNADAT